MKSFLSFFTEARSSNAAETAANMGLDGDGHGNWFKKGQLFAKTVNGRLEYVKKREASKKDEPKQKAQKPQEQPSQSKPKAQETDNGEKNTGGDQTNSGEYGAFGDGKPRRMPQPTRADGTPKDDLGPLTVTFGRFNPPTVGHKKLLDQAKR